MANHSDAAVQKAVYAHLAGHAGLAAALADGAQGVCDHVKADAAFPYIVLGAVQSSAFDTMTYAGCDLVMTLHVYSDTHGAQEVRQILEILQGALEDADLSVEDHSVVMCRVLDAQSAMASDGILREGRLRLRVVTEPAA